MKRRAFACGLCGGLLWSALLLGQPADVLVSGDNLVVSGVPQIPLALAEQAGRYTEFRSADLFDWHPTRREILIGTRFADTNQVHHLAVPGGDRRQLTFFSDRVTSASYHPHHDDYFILTKDHGGNEFFQFYRSDLATGESTLLTDGKSRNTGAVWSNAGERIAYGSTRRSGSDVDFFVMNPAEPASDTMLAQNSGGGWSVVDWSPGDKQLLVSESISINEGYVWLVDAASGEKTLVTPKGSTEKIAYEPVAFSKDGKGIYVLTDRDSEFMRLTFIDVQSARQTCLTADLPWDVESARLSFDGRQVAFVTNDNGISRLHVLDTLTHKQVDVPQLPAGVISHVQWRENHRELGFVITSAHSPADVYSLEVASGRVDRWTTSETGGLNPARCKERIASNPPSTPTVPSKRPALGMASICEPVPTAAASGSDPCQRANVLPTASARISRPASLHRDFRKARARKSASVKTTRVTTGEASDEMEPRSSNSHRSRSWST